MTNTLTYYGAKLITAVKVFIVNGPVVKLLSGWSLPEGSPSKGRLKYWTIVEVTNALAYFSTAIITSVNFYSSICPWIHT